VRLKIAHVATGLGVGGAEMALLNLLSCLDRQTFECEVFSLSSEAPLAERLRALGVPVHILGMKPGLPDPRGYLRLVRGLRRFRPDLIQTWMYHADLLGGLAAPLVGKPPVVWGLHLTLDEMSAVKAATRLVIRFNAHLSSRLPTAIVCCAEAARQTHTAIGYDATRMRVIPNGFDLHRFAPDPPARTRLRAELGLPAATPLIGMAARFHPFKDHRNFFQAAAILHALRPEVHFVLWGKDITMENPDLAAWVRAAGLESVTHLLGLRSDAPSLTAALDLATLSSLGEAFPTVLGEAMACGVPCVSTDVGDAALLLGETGRVVPRRDPQALAQAWAEMLSLSAAQRRALGRAARQRLAERYSLEQMTRAYARLYADIIESRS
jgi:glycosyltransferase involved in cell wall biosynthesis